MASGRVGKADQALVVPTEPSCTVSALTGFDPSRCEETHEEEGPKCPYCGRQYTADEASYYDEGRYTEETCDNCGLTFDVRVYTSTSWTCTPRAAPNETNDG